VVSRLTRILVTGGDGILAQALRPFFPYAEYLSRASCDVTNPQSVRNAFQQVKPELVLHCAAQTSYNAEPYAYTSTNVQGTINVVAQAKRHGSRLVYLSTDYLGAREESSPVQPVNAYAASKLCGELVALSGPNTLCVRGSWYSRLELSHAATDAFTSKLPIDRAAYFVATLATSAHTGVVNIGGVRRSIYELALPFNERVIPVSRTQIHCGYDIPADCSLDTTKLNTWLAA
jgi:dTDP-4-dehydrorhamnose reductase